MAVIRGDDFCANHGVSRIGLLKIDTEGHDVDVLAGFCGMLRDHRIEYVQIECSFSPAQHVPTSRFSSLRTSCTRFGYGLHGIFDLRHKMRTVGRTRGALFGNVVFVRDQLVDR